MKAWLRYFIPRKRWRSVPRVLVETLTSRGADPEELLLIKSGAARNIQHARELFAIYQGTTAAEILKKIPPARRRTFGERLYALFMKFVGHDDRNVYYRKEDNRIEVRYIFKE